MNDWFKDVETIIAERSLLKHPFYRAWQAGTLSLEDLKYYAKAYYAHVSAFPRYVSAAHSGSEDLATRQMLLENLIEEERGPENHPELWLRFCEGLGVKREEVLGASVPAETAACVSTFMGLAKAGTLEGMSALYAYESQIPAVSRTKLQGLKDFYGIAGGEGVKFFEVHETADVWHSQQERGAIEKAAASPEAQERVKAAVKASCDAVWHLLDGVVEARQICTSC
jgi:pyrroloquinoline-quinone synthase